MGLKLRPRTGIIVGFALIAAGVVAPSALATSPLTASKTAEASWTRSYDWTISKSVDKPTIELKSGDSATAKYTVSVVKSAPKDSDVTVKGSVCVKNEGPVATENLTILDRIAATVPGGTLTIELGYLDVSANPVLDPGEDHCYPYSFAIKPRSDATAYRNEAQIRITNDPRAEVPGTPMGPSVSAPFTIPAPTLVNDSINVDDTNGMSWAFSASGSQTYDRTFKCDQDKGTHVNTAKIRQTGASASATVTVSCKPKEQECKDRDKDKGKKDDKGKDKKGKKDDDRGRYDNRGSNDDRGSNDCKDDRDEKDHDWKDKDDRDHDDRDCRDDRRGWRD